MQIRMLSEHRISMEDFFLIPETLAKDEIPMFQANPEDITLPVDFTFEDQPHDGIYRFDEEDRIPPPTDDKMMENLSSVNLETQFQADINEIQ
jgi:hypothetical protein